MAPEPSGKASTRSTGLIIKDVAEEADASIAMVRRVLTRPEDVKTDTRAQVPAALKRRGLRVNPAAGDLRRGHNRRCLARF